MKPRESGTLVGTVVGEFFQLVIVAAAFLLVGLIIGGVFQAQQRPMPSGRILFALVDDEVGCPTLTSVHTAMDIADRHGHTEIKLVEYRYRTYRLPRIPWRFAGQLMGPTRTVWKLSLTNGGWHESGTVRLNRNERSITREFMRDPPCTPAALRCRDILKSHGSPALILQPLGWLVVLYVPIGFALSTVMIVQWARRLRTSAPD